MKEIYYDFIIAAIPATFTYYLIESPELKLPWAIILFIVGIISQRRGWIGP